MTKPTEQLIDELVRDLTSVDYMMRAKSEVRRRINELVATAQKEIKREPEQLIDWEKRFDDFVSVGTNLIDIETGDKTTGMYKRDAKDFIRKEIAEAYERGKKEQEGYFRFTEEEVEKIKKEAIEQTRKEDIALSAERSKKPIHTERIKPIAIADMKLKEFDNVTRVEVIDWKDEGGRVFVHWEKDTKIEVHLQDEERTLKIFLTKRATKNNEAS